MKVIDLLNKIERKESLPLEIKCYNTEFYLSDGMYIAKYIKGKYLDDYIDLTSLDYEVEIIRDKEIERLHLDTSMMGINGILFYDKLNEIIDKINGEE